MKRFVSAIVVLVLTALFLFSYALAESTPLDSLSLQELEELYDGAVSELNRYVSEYSDKYFEEFLPYLSRVEPFSEAGTNWDVWIETLKLSDNFKKAPEKVMYYYILWGPKAEFVDSSFDNEKEPTKLRYPLISDDSEDWIYGFRFGVQEMAPGEIREITIPGKSAYADTYMIEGNYHTPLKAIVLCVPDNAGIKKQMKLLEELGDAILEKYSTP